MAGRTTAARSVASVTTTVSSTALTAPAGSFVIGDDVGAPISGAGIPAGATLVSVASDTAATLSANASATGTVTATVGPQLATSAGFVGFSPTAGIEKDDWTVASVNTEPASPDVLLDNVTRVSQPVSP